MHFQKKKVMAFSWIIWTLGVKEANQSSKKTWISFVFDFKFWVIFAKSLIIKSTVYHINPGGLVLRSLCNSHLLIPLTWLYLGFWWSFFKRLIWLWKIYYELFEESLISYETRLNFKACESQSFHMVKG